MNIVITGATGFLGSALLRYINENELYKNDRIILLTTKNMDGYECILHGDYTFTKKSFLEKGIDSIDILFHLGATTPKISTESGIKDLNRYVCNVTNTIWLLNNIPVPPRKIVFLSSVAVYRSAEVINEETPLEGIDGYGISKLVCESILNEYAKHNDVSLRILRLGQIYGEGEEKYGKIISSFARCILSGRQIILYGDGKAKRSQLYVKDCVKYIIAAANREEAFPPINIAAKRAASIRQMLSWVEKGLGKKAVVKTDFSKSSKDVLYDVSMRNEIFSEIQETDYETGILNFCRYYVKHYGGSL